jgi:hypothetical protein
MMMRVKIVYKRSWMMRLFITAVLASLMSEPFVTIQPDNFVSVLYTRVLCHGLTPVYTHKAHTCRCVPASSANQES